MQKKFSSAIILSERGYSLGRNSLSDENLGVGELGRVTESTLTLQERTKVFELMQTCGEKLCFSQTEEV